MAPLVAPWLPGSGVWATTATALVGMRNGFHSGGSLRIAGDRIIGTVVGSFMCGGCQQTRLELALSICDGRAAAALLFLPLLNRPIHSWFEPRASFPRGYFLLSVMGADVDRFGGLVHILLALWALCLGFVAQNNPRHAYAAVVATLTAQVRRPPSDQTRGCADKRGSSLTACL